jgi:hypothetical protein
VGTQGYLQVHTQDRPFLCVVIIYPSLLLSLKMMKTRKPLGPHGSLYGCPCHGLQRKRPT